MSASSNTSRFWEGLGKLILILPLAAPIAMIPWAAYAQGYVGGGGTATSVSAAAFPLLAPNGSAAAPSYSFSSASGAGMFLNTLLRFAVAGGEVMAVNANGLTLGASADAGIQRVAANVVGSGFSSTQQWIQNEAGDQFLTADHTNATATPTNLTDLTTSVTNARKYVFSLILMCSQSVAADGIRVDFEGGTATATNFRANVRSLDAAAYDTHTSVTALATDVTSTDVGTTVLVEVNGSFEPSSTGTFIPRVGLEAASTGVITTFRGSHLLVKDMP